MSRNIPLTCLLVPYSSIVGGGLQLIDKATGRAKFIVNFMGTTEGITAEETQALSEQFERFVAERGLSVPAR